MLEWGVKQNKTLLLQLSIFITPWVGDEWVGLAKGDSFVVKHNTISYVSIIIFLTCCNTLDALLFQQIYKSVDKESNLIVDE